MISEEEAKAQGLDLVVVKKAAYLIGTSPEMIRYWARKGYIKKYYVFADSKRCYAVNMDEVALQPELGYERKHTLYNHSWASIPRNENNSRWAKAKTKEETNG